MDWRKRSGFLLRRLNAHIRGPILTVISSPPPSLPASRCSSSLKPMPSTRFRDRNPEFPSSAAKSHRRNRTRRGLQRQADSDSTSRCELAFILRETVRLRKKQEELHEGKAAFRETSLRDALLPARLNGSSRLSGSPVHYQRCATALSTPSYYETSKRFRASPLRVRIQLPNVTDFVKFNE